MSLSFRDALDLLACPVCHGDLVMEGEFVRCRGCGRAYPVVDEIPVLLGDRASER